MNLLAAFVKSRSRWHAALALLCVAEVAAVAHFVFFFKAHGYLPSPFVCDKLDTFMDFFHTMFWADREGRYSRWGSVYPPLDFLFLKAVRWATIGFSEANHAFALRDEGRAAQAFLVAAYLAIPAFVVAHGSWSRFSVSEKIGFYVAAGCSMPMLFALERGNLILFILPVLPFLFSRAAWTRALACALLINMKPYFVVLLGAYVVKRRWRELLAALAAASLLYLATSLLLDSDPLALFDNLVGFSRNNHPFMLREVLDLPSSVSAYAYVLNFYGYGGGGLPLAPSTLGFLIEAVKWGVELFAAAALVRARDAVSLSAIFALIVVMISNIGVSVGGYTLIFYAALVPVFFALRYRMAYLGILALVALPLDGALLRDGFSHQLSYLSGNVVNTQWAFTLGSVARPVANLVLLAVLAWEFLSSGERHRQHVAEAKTERQSAEGRNGFGFDSAGPQRLP